MTLEEAADLIIDAAPRSDKERAPDKKESDNGSRRRSRTDSDNTKQPDRKRRDPPDPEPSIIDSIL